MYSQNDEERYILNILGHEPGCFLDIGAYDGKTYSNTFALVQRGWKGVCVEPSPYVLPKLRELYGGNPNITIIPAAIIREKHSRIVFWDNPNAYATAFPHQASKWKKESFQMTEVDALSVDALFSILREWEFFPRFINLDVEGMNMEIFGALPLNELTGLKCLCVEHDGHGDRMQDHAARFGFRVRYLHAENIIFAR